MYSNSNEQPETWPASQGTETENTDYTQGPAPGWDAPRPDGYDTEEGAYMTPSMHLDNVGTQGYHQQESDDSHAVGFYGHPSQFDDATLVERGHSYGPYVPAFPDTDERTQSDVLPGTEQYGGSQNMANGVDQDWSSNNAAPVDTLAGAGGDNPVFHYGVHADQTHQGTCDFEAGLTSSLPSQRGSNPRSSSASAHGGIEYTKICIDCGTVLSGQYASGNMTRHKGSKACKEAREKAERENTQRQREETPPKHICPECQKTYQRSDALLNHRRKRHGHPPGQSKYTSHPS